MGARNSSTTRVVPIFRSLFEGDASGRRWLPGLFRLGSRSAGASLESLTPRLVDGHRPTWGRDELALPAPLALLEYLVKHITEAQTASSGDVGTVLDNRQALARGDPERIAEALRALRLGRRGRQWYVLEGDSRPDATLQMPDAVLVTEGKRTERSCTSTTKWMGTRSQLVRHMDAALQAFLASVCSAFSLWRVRRVQMHLLRHCIGASNRTRNMLR